MASSCYQTALGAMHHIRAGALGDSLSAIGISLEEYQLTTSDSPWLVADRQVVVRVLENLIHGTCDCAGIPRFEVPAEFVAAVLSIFVSPVNTMAACRWMEGSRVAQDMSADEGTIEPLVAAELFALVLRVRADDETNFRSSFEKAVGVKQAKAAKQSG